MCFVQKNDDVKIWGKNNTKNILYANEMIIDGIETNIELHKKILSSKDFKKGAVSIKWLEDNMASL